MSQVENWLRELARNTHVSKSAQATIQSIIESPEKAAYASTQDLASAAGVNTASVTRAAQSLGFEGWPQLRLEIRSRYLNGLTASEMGRKHSESTDSRPPADRSLLSSMDSIQTLYRVLDRNKIRTIAEQIASARQTMVVASGSFAGVGKVLAHNGQLAGYAVNFHSEDSTIAATLPLLTSRDLLVVISFWRLYRTSVQAAVYATSIGCPVLAISDSVDNSLTRSSNLQLVVPTESASHFPSLVGAQVAIEAILSELANLDPKRSQRALAQAESVWETMSVLDSDQIA